MPSGGDIREIEGIVGVFGRDDPPVAGETDDAGRFCVDKALPEQSPICEVAIADRQPCTGMGLAVRAAVGQDHDRAVGDATKPLGAEAGNGAVR